MLDFPEVLIGITEIAVALAGFTGVVVVFGSRSSGSWHPGDRLRLGFLLEASLTAGAFALLALLAYTTLPSERTAWVLTSALWSAYMMISLYRSRLRIRENLAHHQDVDNTANHVVSALFLVTIGVQLVNIIAWGTFAPVLAALVLNLAGAAMQFARLIRSAFHG